MGETAMRRPAADRWGEELGAPRFIELDESAPVLSRSVRVVSPLRV